MSPKYHPKQRSVIIFVGRECDKHTTQIDAERIKFIWVFSLPIALLNIGKYSKGENKVNPLHSE